MQTHPAAPAAPATALGRLVHGSTLHASEGADFKKNTWTFQLQRGQTVAAGQFVILPAAAVHQALKQDVDAIVLPPVTEGECRVDPYFGLCQSLSISIYEPRDLDDFTPARTLFDLTVYREHVPDKPDDARWHPAHWWGSERRLDNQGREWSRRIRAVQDDFGFLAEIEA